mmetsp:Transcript_27719/g.38976  ORF Transcript_27719/g.38976 Transcript_27719/m.38976 type:complete len:204 (-) Transcript_27719:415-1026(-)
MSNIWHCHMHQKFERKQDVVSNDTKPACSIRKLNQRWLVVSITFGNIRVEFTRTFESKLNHLFTFVHNCLENFTVRCQEVITALVFIWIDNSYNKTSIIYFHINKARISHGMFFKICTIRDGCNFFVPESEPPLMPSMDCKLCFVIKQRTLPEKAGHGVFKIRLFDIMQPMVVARLFSINHESKCSHRRSIRELPNVTMIAVQ